MLASAEFDDAMQHLAELPRKLALQLRQHADVAEEHATTFRSHFNIFDGTGHPRALRARVCVSCAERHWYWCMVGWELVCVWGGGGGSMALALTVRVMGPIRRAPLCAAPPLPMRP
jgi:hypothetical protein